MTAVAFQAHKHSTVFLKNTQAQLQVLTEKCQNKKNARAFKVSCVLVFTILIYISATISPTTISAPDANR